MVEQNKGNKDGLLHGLIRRALGLPGGFYWLVRPHKVSNKVSKVSVREKGSGVCLSNTSQSAAEWKG